MNENPLKQYFRSPAIYLKLPTGGKFYPEGALEKTETGELAVFPMTAIDEITYKTPDALFNGTAVADVIKSCIPAIKDPWIVPNDDLVAILSAIRIASFGHNLEIETTCPSCNEIASYSLDLRTVLDTVQSIDYSKPMELGELKFYFRPLSYKEINDNSMINFEEQKLASVIGTNIEMGEDEKLKMLSEAFKKVSNFTLDTIVKNIAKIETPDVSVSEDEFILDFLRQCERAVYDQVKEYILNQRQSADMKPLSIKCDACDYEYEQPFTLDMTSFFG